MEEIIKGLSLIITNNVVKLFLNAEINDDISQKFTEILYGLEFLHEDTPFEAVVISIASPGGNVDSGYAMFSALKMSTLPIYIINSGIVASIAGIIFLGVDYNRRWAFENSLFMLHEAYGSPDQNIILKINKSLSTILGTAITPLLVEKMMSDETWLDVNEQVNFNIIPPNNIIKVSEKFDISQIISEKENGIFNIYNSTKLIKNNEKSMNLNFIEKLKSLRNSIIGDENIDSVVESQVEEEVESQVEEEVEAELELEDISTEVESESESEEAEQESEEVEIKAELEEVEPILSPEMILINELRAEILSIKTEKDSILAEIENSKKLETEKINLELKKSFLIENKVDISSDLLELDLDKLKKIVNAVKVNKTAPIVSNKASDISSNIPEWSKMNDTERDNLFRTNRPAWEKALQNKK
jgi:ATP-dependent Clp protease protease subunit